MLLVEITINAVVNYVSVDGHALTHNWRPRILSFDAPTYAIPEDYGGFAELTFGNIIFNPDLFIDHWPAPVSCPISIYYTETNEAERELVFTGTAHISGFDRESVSYALYGPDYDEEIAASTAYNNTLNNVITAILTTIAEINHVDTSYARVVSPNVTHTTSGKQLAIKLASDIAAFYSHLVYIVDDTAYLVDMKLDNGSEILTEFDYFSAPAYICKTPTAIARCGNFSRSSSYPYGTELSVTAYHTTEANVNAALDDIIAIKNAPSISFDIPMIPGNFPVPGRKITIPDTAHVADLSSYIRVRKLVYNFTDNVINVEGEGAISAA